MLRTDRNRKDLMEEILRLEANKVWSVAIEEYQPQRTINQNSLMWKWETVIGNELGETKDEIHFRHKRDYLKPIYERDDPEFAETVEAVRAVHREGSPELARTLMDKIVRLISTTTAKKAQLSEFMDEIKGEARYLNITLPQPGYAANWTY